MSLSELKGVQVCGVFKYISTKRRPNTIGLHENASCYIKYLHLKRRKGVPYVLRQRSSDFDLRHLQDPRTVGKPFLKGFLVLTFLEFMKNTINIGHGYHKGTRATVHLDAHDFRYAPALKPSSHVWPRHIHQYRLPGVKIHEIRSVYRGR